ncbi:MAG: hypothetical protein ACXV6K_03035 [Halobacteriota archaeon]
MSLGLLQTTPIAVLQSILNSATAKWAMAKQRQQTLKEVFILTHSVVSCGTHYRTMHSMESRTNEAPSSEFVKGIVI